VEEETGLHERGLSADDDEDDEHPSLEARARTSRTGTREPKAKTPGRTKAKVPKKKTPAMKPAKKPVKKAVKKPNKCKKPTKRPAKGTKGKKTV